MSKPQPNLLHMPRLIQEKILDFSSTDSKLSLRATCKDFKHLVDSCRVNYDRLEMYWDCDDEYIRLVLANGNNIREIHFHGYSKGCYVKNVRKEEGKTVRGGDFIDLAMEHFLMILKYPKVHLEVFELGFQIDYFQKTRFERQKTQLIDKMTEILGTFNHKLNVNTFVMDIQQDAGDIAQILPYLKPGTLRTLELSAQRPHSSSAEYKLFDLSSISHLDQWKRAEQLKTVWFHLDKEFAKREMGHFKLCKYRVAQ